MRILQAFSLLKVNLESCRLDIKAGKRCPLRPDGTVRRRAETRVPVGRFRPWLVTPLVFEEFLSASQHTHLKEIYDAFCQHPKP